MAPVLAGLMLGITPMMAAAQDEGDEQEADDADVERIVVTGSRLITNPNVQAPNPVLTVGPEEITARGTTRIEDLTNQLPQVFAGQASEVSNGASGTSTLNLRGLGAIRTLVLIDGRRLPFGDSATSTANLNIVPTQLIERVDIVTGGASAVYGSDAVAGVANFILKDDFQGLEIDIQGGFHNTANDSDLMDGILSAAKQPIPSSTFSDARELQLSVTMGANSPDGRGNVTAHFNYENLNGLRGDQRIHSVCQLGSSSGEFAFRGLGCVGSSNFRRFANFAPGVGDDVFQNADGTLRFVGTNFVGTPETTFNFQADNFIQRPIERFQFYTKADYDLTDDIEMFMDMTFVNSKSDAQIGPSASFGFWDRINCDNPLIQGQEPTSLFNVFGCNVPDADGNLPDEVGPIFASHRMVEGEPRNSNLDNSAWRTVGGFRGTIFEDYDFELFGQFSRTQDKDISTNDLLIDNVQDAFLVVEGPDGTPVCRSGNDGCVPFNIFQRTPDGGTLVTQEAVDYVTGVGITTGRTQQLVFGGNIQTDLGNYGVASPFADSGVGMLVGWEYRKDELDANPDQVSQRPDGGFTGVGGPTLPVEGEVKVNEFYAETQIPLVSGAPFAENLALGGAYRYSDYTTDGNNVKNDFDTDTYHVFLNWSPIEDLRLRAQFQRAVRAPNVIELFTPQGTNLPDLTEGPNGFFDPCAGPNPAASLEQCALTGVTPEQYGTIPDVISGQTQSITGGNPLLEPEESETVTLGAIITPAALPGFSLSIDYFDITVDDAIQAGAAPAQQVLDECLQTGDDTFCNLITRDQGGSLIAGTPGVGFTATNINIATLETTGVDIQAVYDLDLWDLGIEDMGSVRFDYASTILDSLQTEAFPGAAPLECAGKVLGGCRAPSPEYRHRMITTWDTPWDLRVNAIWRYFSSVDNVAGKDAVGNIIDRGFDRVQYLDLSAEYMFSDSLTFRAGVNNLLDKNPPLSTSAGTAPGNGNIFPTVYDAQGRFIFLGATYRL